MMITVRGLLKSAAALFATLLGSGSASFAFNAERQTLTISGFIARLRQDPVLRKRFADNPRVVLPAYGIDPAPYNLPDRMSEAQMDRLLERFAQAQAPAPSEPPAPPVGPPPAPVQVYGPPPRPPRPALGSPPAPVYGPPPGHPK